MKFLILPFLVILANTYLSIAILYRGTLCGWAETDTNQPILCNRSDPRYSCPANYARQLFGTGGASCYTSNTSTTVEYGLTGTICGGMANNPCGAMIPVALCPPGYIHDFRHICYKSNPNMEDLSGTFCGVVSKGVGPTCDGLPIERCPQGYYPINYEVEQWHACVKD